MMRSKFLGLGLLVSQLSLVSLAAVAQVSTGNATPTAGSTPNTDNQEEQAPDDEDDVVRRASDAFGVRIGSESFGLYNESLARGFSLEAAGNYRLDGLFYVPAVTPASPLVDSSTVRVGLAALPFDFPAPSGVVDYALRGPAAKPFVELRVGIESYESPTLASDFSIGSQAFGIAGGMQVTPNANYSDGTEGEMHTFGLVPQWQLSERTQLRGLIGGTLRRYNGNIAYVAEGSVLPPDLAQFERFVPDNAEFEQKDFNIGLLLQHQFAFADLRAGIFRSVRSRPESDFILVSELDPQGRGVGTLFTAPDQHSESISGEISLLRQFEVGNWTHRVTGSLRARQSDTLTYQGSATQLGPVQIGAPYTTQTTIDRTRGDASTNKVEQSSAGLSWRSALGDRLEIRAGVLRTTNQKDAFRANAAPTRNASVSWLPNASVTWQAKPNLALYASYVRGLEESGVAPGVASNRNEVLPAVLARQIDFGMRMQLSESNTFTAALFHIDKPTPALDVNRFYSLSGEASYRGLEASWNRRMDNGLSWVLGAVVMDLDRQEINQPTRTAVGLPEKQALLGLSYTPKSMPALSFDSQIRSSSSRYANRENLLSTPGFTSTDLGLRYRYGNDGSNLRFQWINATDKAQWVAIPSETLSNVRVRTVRLIWTKNF
jgi:iron complex outermembrane recepter protein